MILYPGMVAEVVPKRMICRTIPFSLVIQAKSIAGGPGIGIEYSPHYSFSIEYLTRFFTDEVLQSEELESHKPSSMQKKVEFQYAEES